MYADFESYQLLVVLFVNIKIMNSAQSQWLGIGVCTKVNSTMVMTGKLFLGSTLTGRVTQFLDLGLPDSVG